MNPRSMVKKLIPRGLFRIIEPYGHWVEAMIAQTLNGFPARNLKIIGVTGTDGKTSTCIFIAEMLRNAGYKVALLTTISIDYGDGSGEHSSKDHMTTSSAGVLAKNLKRIKSGGVDWVVLETSSFALAQYRVWGIPYSVAVLTNITHEHLDYHRTFERYIEAKLKLFKQCNRNKRGLRVGIINADDPSSDLFISATANPVSYGLKNGDLHATQVKMTSSGSSYSVATDSDEYHITCHLPGEFNIYNSLAAVGVGRAIGLTKVQIEKGIDSLKFVKGRMMPVIAGQDYSVFIDYAVTPMALQNVLTAVRSLSDGGSVLVVFGATGDRDKSKRGPMGEVAAKFADKIFITDDETHKEDPRIIRQSLIKGVISGGGTDKYEEIADRGEAIKAALKQAKKGDMVVISGLGHQSSRNMGGNDEPWSDAEIAKLHIEKSKKL